MARERNPERDKARRIWLDSGGTLTARQVAEQVGVKPEQVRKWKSLDSWAAELEAQKPPRKRGGQPGNKNAAGAGAPHGNRNAETHGAYSTVRLADLPDEQREYIESITLDTGTNMLSELQLLIAKEADLQSKIAKIENGDPDALYIDRVVEMRAPKSTERLEQQQEKLETLRRKRDDLTWEIDSGPDGKPPSKAKQKQLDALQREIAALEDTTADRQMELEKSSYKVNMQTVIKASAFDRAMKLEAELNKIHGRIIKLLDSIKGYEKAAACALKSANIILRSKNYQERSTLTLKRAKSSTKWTTRAATRKFEIGSFGGAYGLRVRDAQRFFSHEIFLNASGPCRFFQYGGVFSRNKGLGGVKNRETLRRAGDCPVSGRVRTACPAVARRKSDSGGSPRPV